MSQKLEPAIPSTAVYGPGYRIEQPPSATRPRGSSAADAPHPAPLLPEASVRRLDPNRDLRALVLFLREPIFALAPGRTDDDHFDGRRDGQPVCVGAAAGGRATVDDADALIPLISELTALKNEGRPLPHTVVLRPAAALRVLGRSGGGRQRRLLDDAFVRLAATTITRIDAFGTRAFRPIERVEQLPGGARRFTLAAALVAEVEAGRVLKLDPAALRLKGLERRLYSLARAHTGRDGTWRVDLDLLVRLCPWRGTWRKFRSRLAAVAAAQALPGFVLTVADLDGRLTLFVSPTLTAPLTRTEPAAAEATDLNFFVFDEADAPGPAAEPVMIAFPDEIDL